MIHLVDQALERHLREHVPLPPAVEISFDAPDKEWSSRLSGPAVNCFLWDVSRNAVLEHTGVMQSPGTNGPMRKRPDPSVDLRYLVTAWANQQRDEHQLLGAALAAILAERTVDVADLPAPLDVGPGPLVLKVDATEDKRMSDLWSSLDGQLKPSLRLTATLTIDAGGLLAVGPPTTGVGLRTTDADSGATSGRALVSGRIADPAAAGATVHTARGSGTVGEDGRFAVPGAPGDVVTVDLDPPRSTTVPASGVIELE